MKSPYYIVLLVFLTGLYDNAAGQTTLTLQPDSTTGKDALIFMKTVDVSAANTNYDNRGSFEAIACTWNGDSGIMRSLLQFDLSVVPIGSIIQNATLSLFNDSNSLECNGEQQSLSGSNAAVLQKITATWNENTVTWNNQPATTTVNEVMLPQSISIHEDYPNIDVTAMVADMVANPANNFGFMIKLVDEFHYRSMIFASSDNVDSTLHPKLVITYSPLSVIDIENNTLFDINPNPSSGVFSVNLNSSPQTKIDFKIVNAMGQKVFEGNIPPSSHGKIEINLTSQSKGVYFAKVFNGEKSYCKKLIIE